MADPLSELPIIPLPGPIGAEVVGLDLARLDGITNSLTTDQIDAVRQALSDRHLLLLRGGVMTGEQQTAFVSRFGTLIAERTGLWGYVSNVRPDGIVREGALPFHSDFAFAHTPLDAIALHAIDLPGSGSCTVFADAVHAAVNLPADLRARLEGRSVLNLFDFTQPSDRPMRLDIAHPGAPRWIHPIVGTHPATGAPVIMANQLHTIRVVGLAPAESDALLAELWAVLYGPQNLYRHHWSLGDLVLWDNVALHHGRPDVPTNEPRTLQRNTLGRYTAGELVPGLGELLGRS